MPYQEVFGQLWKQVEESIQEGNFVKLTMAKTIGKPNLKNIFLWPIYSDDGLMVLIKHRYRSKEDDDTEDEMMLIEALNVIKSHLKNPFSSVVVFTTSKDLLFKVNKKGVGSITENLPTFKNVIQVDLD